MLLLLALALLHTPPVQRYAFKQLRTVLLEKSKIDIQATGFRFNLFRMDAAVEGLTVRAAEAPDLPPLFRADAVYARPQIGRIAKGFLDFRELRLTAPKIHYYVGADGKSNVPAAEKAAAKYRTIGSRRRIFAAARFNTKTCPVKSTWRCRNGI